MQSKASAGKGQSNWASIPQLLDISAPIVALMVTGIIVMERTPRQEPLVYAGVIAALIALTLASARNRGAYGLWALYIGSFAMFGIVRSFADETGVGVHVGDLVSIERTLSFGTVPTVWLQSRLFDPNDISWLDRGATYVHWSYFVLPHIFAAHLFLGYRRLFERYVMVFVGVLIVGIIVYFLFPAAPPWVAALKGDIAPTHKIATEVGSEFHVNLYQRFESQIRSSNPVAAMPSLHMAIAVVVLLIAVRVNWVLGIAALAYNVAMGFSLVYLGEHYVTDILAGAIVAVGVYVALHAFLTYRERQQARPLEQPQTARPLGGPQVEPDMQA